MPKVLAPNVLYVSKEYSVAGHLCACGCGNKVVVPLGPAEWAFSEHKGLPTLWPSIGNWQLACRSHYLITDGQIQWSHKWSDKQIAAGRSAEEQKRQSYYASLERKNGFWASVWKWLQNLFKQ